MMIGVNQHFLLAFKKPMNSETSPVCLPEARERDSSSSLGWLLLDSGHLLGH